MSSPLNHHWDDMGIWFSMVLSNDLPVQVFFLVLFNTLHLYVAVTLNISTIWIENEDPKQPFWKCLIIYSEPNFAVRWILIRLCGGTAVFPKYWMLQVLYVSKQIRLLVWYEIFSQKWLIMVYFCLVTSDTKVSFTKNLWQVKYLLLMHFETL